MLLEGASRLYWRIAADVPFFRQKDIIYWFYPELKSVAAERIDKEDGYYDILILGGSVLSKAHSMMGELMQKHLQLISHKKVRVHNLAAPAHTVQDSYSKYAHLHDKMFDMVVFYHGINDARANNCPASFFKDDYSHFLWYDCINAYERHTELNLCVLPFTMHYGWALIGNKAGFKKYLMMEKPKEAWLAFGREVKSAGVFRKNLTKIAELSRKKKEALLLMTFVYYIPDDYSRQKYIQDALDYRPSTHLAPVELWGEPAHVRLAIEAHNQVVREAALTYPDAFFIEQDRLFPKEGKYFLDVCHLSPEGEQLFVTTVVQALASYMSKEMKESG